MRHLILLGIGLVFLGASPAEADDKPLQDAGQERIELAKRIYRERILNGLGRRAAPPRPQAADGPNEDPILNETMAEELHRWSVRWLEAESDAATTKAGREAAALAHLDRMKSLESGKLVRKELADHPMVKELDDRKLPLVDIDAEEIRKLAEVATFSEGTRHFPDVARYFRLEAEARLAREKAGVVTAPPAKLD